MQALSLREWKQRQDWYAKAWDLASRRTGFQYHSTVLELLSHSPGWKFFPTTARTLHEASGLSSGDAELRDIFILQN